MKQNENVLMQMNELLGELLEIKDWGKKEEFDLKFSELQHFLYENKKYNYQLLMFLMKYYFGKAQSLRSNIISFLFEGHSCLYSPVMIGKNELSIYFLPKEQDDAVSFKEIEELMLKSDIKTLKVNFSRKINDINAYIRQDIVIESKGKGYDLVLKKDLDLSGEDYKFTHGFEDPEYFLLWQAENHFSFNNDLLNIDSVFLKARYFIQKKDCNEVILFDNEQLYLASLLFCDSNSRVDYVLSTTMKEIEVSN